MQRVQNDSYTQYFIVIKGLRFSFTIYKQSHVLYHMKHTNNVSSESRYVFYHWFDGTWRSVAADLNDADSTTCIRARHDALREKVKPRKMK